MKKAYIYLVLFILFLLILKFLENRFKGDVGELAVKRKLRKLNKKKYLVLNNLTLRNYGGNTSATQIDHVVISIYGIYVIETKNYKGIIYGSENSKKWTYNIYGNKYKFMNPINQNYAHIKAIKNAIGKEYKNLPYYSIIAFSNEAKVNVDTSRASICKISKVSKIIKSQAYDEILSYEDILYIKEKLEIAQ
ncbi:nuclease-related domain-containing protein [Anaerococcus sp. ENR1011]|uniref:Nuclease-related domain-containing protein n=1 Tax=Anaerococcus groningensis TaxID=3115616 RepID=A0ABW9MY50_9FIRM